MNCFSFIEFHPVSAVFNEGKLFHNIYDASGERTLKAQGEYQGLFENGVPTDGGVQLNAYTTYPSPYITISPKEVYTKHYFAGTQRVASKPEGKADIFNTSPLHGYEELKIRQLGDAQAVADTVDLGIITLGGPIEEPVNPDVYYFHPDHLGTSTMISDGSGYAYQFFLNLPFGETFAEQRRSGSFDNPYKFNGKELDEETGLYYYGARYYNPRVSMWLSVDPLAEKYPGWSPYNYTLNNPVFWNDPDGMSPEHIDPTAIYFSDYKGNLNTPNLVESWEFFASTEIGINFLKDFAQAGQTIAGHTYDKDGKYHEKGINLVLGTGDCTIERNKRKLMAASGLTDSVIRLGGIDITIDIENNSKNEFSNLATFLHEFFIHAIPSAEDFYDNGKLDFFKWISKLARKL